MLTGRFFLEISPGQLLWAEGPWHKPSSSTHEWEIAILPFKPLGATQASFLRPQQTRILTRHDLQRFAQRRVPEGLNWQPSQREAFQSSFLSLQALISQGKLRKGVPFASQKAFYEKPALLWETLLGRVPQLPPELNAYGAELSEEKVLGASPQWLFRVEEGGKVLHTMAIAGTRWKEQVRTGPIHEKERAEHAWVVDDLTERLRPFGNVFRGETGWVKAGILEHLQTPLRVESSQPLHALEMVELFHPTPALGIFPRSPEGSQWLHSLPESEIRADFGAPWVVQHRSGKAFALVALRQLRLREDHLWIPAGCGVVAASNEKAEWEEIQTKILSVKKAWGLDS